MRFQKEEAEFTEWEETGLRKASKYVFYNTSKWTLKRLKETATNSQQLLQVNFQEYLNGFSPNVKEIIEKFKLASQIKHMADKDVLLDVLEKFTSPNINLTPFEKEDGDGRKLAPLSNLGMGYVFEELIRKFNEENNEEAGEHFTPREVIDLMTHIIFEPIKDELPPVLTIYDPACGSGGMLTESQNFIKDPYGIIKAKGDVYLYGKEINDETFAICKSDMMIKGDDLENIKLGSTLSTDEFAGKSFDFMLSNPPYGKSWATEVKYIKDGKDIIDPRFEIELKNYWGETELVDATPRSSDGQLLFLMEMVDKMKPLSQSPKGSRIASVHNGSSLFTGDAGGGESNIRRYLIENDYLSAIIQLPNNLFYNTGITTYIWLLTNHKPAHRKGKVQLIDAGQSFIKLRKNLGAKNCELSPQHIKDIMNAYEKLETLDRKEPTDLAAKVFDNADFGYYKATIERPKRLKAQFTEEKINDLRYDKSLKEAMEWAYETLGEEVYTDLAKHEKSILSWCEQNDFDLNAKKRKALLSPKTWEKQKLILDGASYLLENIGSDIYDNFNDFQELVDRTLSLSKASENNDIQNTNKRTLSLSKGTKNETSGQVTLRQAQGTKQNIALNDRKDNSLRQAQGPEQTKTFKLSSSEKNAIYNAVSWYDETADKVIKKYQKLNADKLKALLNRLNCTEEQLPDYGYFPSTKKGEYIIYETESDLRDYENIPIKEEVHAYFLKEVKPHVAESWIDLEKTKIGYEISFNKYFYQHKALRTMEEVSAEILALEKENEGLIMDILNLG